MNTCNSSDTALMLCQAGEAILELRFCKTYSINNVDSPAAAGRRRLHDPRPFGPVVRGAQLLELDRHQERGGDEVEVLQAAEVLHLLYVLEQLVFSR